MADRSEFAKSWSRLVAEAWHDDDLKGRLLADPAAVLEEHGIEVPEGRALKTHENTHDVIHLVIPTKPPREIGDWNVETSSEEGYFYTVF